MHKPSLKNLQDLLFDGGWVRAVWDELSLLIAHCVESAQKRFPSAISCMGEAQGVLTAGQGKEVASRIVKITCERAYLARIGSEMLFMFESGPATHWGRDNSSNITLSLLRCGGATTES